MVFGSPREHAAIHVLIEPLLLLHAQQLLFDPALHFFEFENARGTALDELRDMEAELSAKDSADGSDAHRKHNILKCRDHLAAREESQVAAGAGAIGKFVGNLAEGPALIQFAASLFNTRVCIGLRMLLIHILHNVGGADLLRRFERIAVLQVVSHHLFVTRRGGGRCNALDQMLQAGFFFRLGLSLRRLLPEEYGFDQIVDCPFARPRPQRGGILAGHPLGHEREHGGSLPADFGVFDRLAIYQKSRHECDCIYAYP